MDLRRRLLGRLGILLGGMLAVAMLIQMHSLRDDVEAEIAASARLVGVLVAAGESGPDALSERLDDAGLRHLSIRPADQPTAAQTASSRSTDWPAWLGLTPRASSEERIQIGGRTLVIAPNPDSEIEERLGDSVRLLITLLLYSGATLVVAWFVADRALRPVRHLEAGLNRLASGAPDPALPAFALREFSQVAGAIDSLAGKLHAARAAQHALARQLIRVQEDERRALARELHDDMGQSLTALNVTAAHLERNAARLDTQSIVDCAADLRRDLRTCGDQVRAMLQTLRPHGLDAASLPDCLRELVSNWTSRETGISFSLNLTETPLPIDEQGALALYRVVQEAVTNVVRHSGASHCEIALSCPKQGVLVTVTDNGQGIPNDPDRQGGLLGMTERLEMAGGWLKLDNASPFGKTPGLQLLAWVPSSHSHDGAAGSQA